MEGRSQQDSADEARAGVGASGKWQAEAARAKAEDDARRLAIVADPGPAMSVLGMEPSRR